MSVKKKVEELLALRDSVSESAVSIEKFADEEAVREHVLRPAASTSSMGLRATASVPVFRGRLDTGRSSSTTANSFLAAPTSGNVNAGAPTHSNVWKKPSPTPSLKRDKIQRLIKEHGSPPGLRVTAGGRIVPQDMPGLGSPQYPVNNNSKMGEWNMANVQSNGIQRATSQPPYLRRNSDAVPPPAFEPMSRSNSSNTAVNTTIPAYAPSFNPAFMPFFFPAAPYGYPQAQPRPFSVPAPASNNTNNTNNTAQAEIAELRKMLEKIHMEQRDLEREMVIRENALTTEERQNMVEQKVQMINESDRIRKDIKRIESDEPSGPASFEQQKPAFPQPPGLVAPQSGPQPSLNPYMFSNGPHAFVPFAPGGQFPSPYMLPSIVPFSGFTSLDGASSTPGGEGTAPSGDNATKPTKEYKDKQEMQINQENPENPEKSEKPASHGPRRSHALEIKDPNKTSDQKITSKRSVLDPTSPAYTPQKKTKSETSQEDSSLVFVPPSPSPIASPQRNAAFAAHFPWLCSDRKDEKKNDGTVKISPEPSVRSSAHRPSASSINTADFFPNNPHEHSSTSYNIRNNTQNRQITPDRSQFAWTNVFQSPDESQTHLRAPQVSPVDGASLRNDSALGMHQSENLSIRNAQLRVPQANSRQESDKISSAGRLHAPAPSFVGQLDFRSKSVTFLLGFSAGLSGQPIQGTEEVDYMQGWAQGLLSAKQSNSRQPSEAEESVSSTSEEHIQPRQSSFLHPESVINRLDEGMPRPMGYMQLSATPMHKVSTSTLKATPSIQEPRPFTAHFESYDTTKSISSCMGIGPAAIPTPYRTVSGETNKTVTEKIDAMMNAHQAPMMQHSGNERDEMKPSDRSNQSPSKLSRVFSGQSLQAQGQQKLNRGFNLNCLGDQREQARHSRTSYDGAADDEIGETSGTETTNARVSPSKGSAFTGSPSVSTGSPKKLSKTAVKNKFEEVAGNVGGVGKGKKSRKHKKTDHDETDDPAKMSRDDKKNWREMWKKRFEGIRDEEQREIDRYRSEYPLPQ